MSSLRFLVTACAAGTLISACARKPILDEHISHMSAGDMATPAGTPGTSLGSRELPPSNNQAAARLQASPRHSEWVKVAWEAGSKDSLMAFIVYPSTSNAKTPVVVVVHEIFGLSTWVRGVADQVAAEGFIAIAPDLLSRVRGGPSTVELSGDSARKLIANVDVAERNRGIDAVARYAMGQASAAPRYAVIGFCWGGSTVWGHVINGGTTGFSGGVAYYGLPPMAQAEPGAPAAPVRDSLAKIQKPVILLSGSKDARIGAAMPAVETMMKSLGKSYYGKNYEGAIHGFLRAQDDPTNPPDEATQKANLEASKDAWPRTVTFLKTNLGVK
jgi:carboxymethylenebutenolidase